VAVANGIYQRVVSLASELVHDRVDVIVVDSTPAAVAAKVFRLKLR